ncbi:hypothetical protein EG856_01535 [Mycoplasmopsis phocirhinis]|uniref:F0F1 ATP synthase subunit gamma n=1 Tax=Mycoplasmopsis phocirhinis TaxID=142650 RepID=A0A4V0ZAG3_9BACT|nr:hypothetical protein [Mycoplasmopsis phocirhinis]QBF34602.1 hypothetical protein EG856_01535 [Mycoplasmopsis phocirhinis]
MHFKKIEQKKSSLENIYTRVNNDKNILLIDIMKLNKKLKFYVDNALANKSLITNLRQSYNIRNDFIQNKSLTNTFINKIFKFFGKKRELWVYLTEEQKHSTDSYSRYEKMILENIKKTQADFIAIGDRAIEFIKSNKLNLIKSFKQNHKNVNIAKELTFLIKYLYVDEAYDSVRFVINTNKNFKNAFTILPLENFDVDQLSNEIKQPILKPVKKYEIYPNLEQFIDSEINIFLSNAIHSLIIESYFYNAKNNLISTNQIIKQLDEDILKLNKKIIKFKREKEIEDIVMFFRKKRGADNE